MEQPYSAYPTNTDNQIIKSTNGVYEYPNERLKSNITLQNIPEFQKSLGHRSRFGDGDGSFFDKWLNSDSTKRGFEFDLSGLPKSERLTDPRSGFKRQYTFNKWSNEGRDDGDGESKGGNRNIEGYKTVKKYSERRKERLEK